MARRAVDPSSRIARLEAVRETLQPDEIWNLAETAAALGITERQMKNRIDADPDMPIKVRGHEGLSYQFAAAVLVEYEIGKAKAQKAERESRMERLRELTGLETPDVAGDLTLQEMREIDRIQTASQRRKIEQGRYVPREDHQRIVGDLLSTFQSETLGLISRIDAAGKLAPDVREMVEEDLRDMLVRTHDRAAEKLGPHAA